MKLIFREGRAEHLSAIDRLERVCFSDPWSEEALRQTLTLPAAFCLTAWLADENAASPYVSSEPQVLAGYLFSYALPPEGEIANLAVAPECRRRGIGEALLKEGLSRMKEKGCQCFFLEVRETNLAAQALYAKLGFKVMGRRKKYYQNPKEDALLMLLPPLVEER